MKGVNRLLFFFYGTGQPVAQAAPKKKPEDFSRRRFHGRAFSEMVLAVASHGVYARARGTVTARASSGSLSPVWSPSSVAGGTSAARAQAVPIRPTSIVYPSINGHAVGFSLSTIARAVAHMPATATAGAKATSGQGPRAPAHAPARMRATIGPDIVQLEDEEILLLLEVA